jgi:5'-phosphate synthase pdxT subunit
VDSFEADLPVPALGAPDFHAVFIRAPKVQRVGDDVEVLASINGNGPVAAQQGNMLVTAFHPELTRDTRFHSHFLRMSAKAGQEKK